MSFGILPNHNVTYLDKILLNEDGLFNIYPADYLRSINLEHLMVWANKKGFYCLPTTELIDWLRNRIAGRRTIEICAGNGAISRALGIIGTDSYIQTSAAMVTYYTAFGQKPIEPPIDIYKLEANDAVDHFKPKVVVASFATQKYLPGDEGPPVIGSSIYGVDELSLLPKIQTYISIGNDSVHQDKRIRQFPFEIYRFDWLFTRCLNQSLNHICVWEKK